VKTIRSAASHGKTGTESPGKTASEQLDAQETIIPLHMASRIELFRPRSTMQRKK